MPKELKKRGRREVKRQKLDHEGDISEPAAQGFMLPTQEFVSGSADNNSANQLPFESSIAPGATFFGLLDEQEQEYFRRADEMLEANQFKSDEEKNIFIQNVLKETENKELKMACSQGCSRLLEKLISLANPDRVKIIFQRFHGHFGHLMEHRFASHCCEALFAAAASVAATEYLNPIDSLAPESQAALVPAEHLFLCTISEIEPLIDGLLMNPFGAHVLRTLFLVLSGAPLDSQPHKSLVHSKRKENMSTSVKKSDGTPDQARVVPESFREALNKIINTITADINRENIRNLATDPLGSPTLQLLIELDLGRSRKYKTKIENSLVGKLLLQLPEDDEREMDSTEGFVKMLLQDTVGSHLLETLLTCVPKKTFNHLYNQYFRDTLGNLATIETASFVVVKVLDKLETQELKAAEEELRKGLPTLLQNGRVAVVRAVIENCKKHGISADTFCDTLFGIWNLDVAENQKILLRILGIDEEELQEKDDKRDQRRSPRQLHASLLLQSLLSIPGKCSTQAKACIISCPAAVLQQLCKHPTASHAIQKSIDVDPKDLPYKRKIAGLLAGSIVDLAVHPIGSHVVDTMWDATLNGLKLQRQRFADELLGSEQRLRDSLHGRAVWRNWKMDMYKTKRYDWNNLTVTSKSNGPQAETAEVKQSAIQIASAKHAAMERAKEVGVQETGNIKEEYVLKKRKVL